MLQIGAKICAKDMFNYRLLLSTKSITFISGDIVYSILKGPLELAMGIAFGCICGMVLWYIPSKDQVSGSTSWLVFVWSHDDTDSDISAIWAVILW